MYTCFATGTRRFSRNRFFATSCLTTMVPIITSTHKLVRYSYDTITITSKAEYQRGYREREKMYEFRIVLQIVCRKKYLFVPCTNYSRYTTYAHNNDYVRRSPKTCSYDSKFFREWEKITLFCFMFEQIFLCFIPLVSEIQYCHMCIGFKNDHRDLNKLVADENITAESKHVYI